jgi:hypothetical protein
MSRLYTKNGRPLQVAGDKVHSRSGAYIGTASAATRSTDQTAGTPRRLSATEPCTDLPTAQGSPARRSVHIAQAPPPPAGPAPPSGVTNRTSRTDSAKGVVAARSGHPHDARCEDLHGDERPGNFAPLVAVGYHATALSNPLTQSAIVSANPSGSSTSNSAARRANLPDCAALRCG